MQPLNILVLVGSPRNEESWTYKSIRILEEKMQAIQPVEFEYIFVQKLHLPFCDGCLKCVNVGESACPDYAKVGPIADKINKADGIILGSPVHTFNVTGLMKNFFEYFMYKRNRPTFFGKKAVVTSIASGGGHTVVMDFLEQTANAWGCDVVSRMGISSSQMLKESYLKRVDVVAEEVADTFVSEINEGKLGSPKFRHLINFRAMQNMAYRQKNSINHKFWEDRGWFDAEYYNKVPINIFARVMAGYIAGKMRKSTRKGNQNLFR
ncbi:MAG: NAD(P)H-dependent oxidoreductase [Gammaproteobacteria bacterium]|nr:NAD(P)H-dependent oxidoreductase [Gammaproteobacteria bacterium]MCP4088289.1 NAD(P)H-dependent oxidoreductase [Gammaproteobacteria bacterium]MCP4276400.1 NAD(P)H-dependent oxidoreductase [Gammaproteobacteria bacterium]MCP4831047.1 NAD(P)H-dependent oxidoreductase [Gammaproteobacteria bacterium]MCP4927432.1 NAD(P)H-dependent oxidoreductase [Gammaproteobacteria bacterium]